MRIDLDNPVIYALARGYDILYATALFLLGCLPVVTIGASCAAIHATMMSTAPDSCGGQLFPWQLLCSPTTAFAL